MKFIVCVKLTPDTEQLVEVQPQVVGSGDLGVTMVLNPWDEFAVERRCNWWSGSTGKPPW
jgi:electron transfer flavoprotein alpha/beta subunit